MSDQAQLAVSMALFLLAAVTLGATITLKVMSKEREDLRELQDSILNVVEKFSDLLSFAISEPTDPKRFVANPTTSATTKPDFASVQVQVPVEGPRHAAKSPQGGRPPFSSHQARARLVRGFNPNTEYVQHKGTKTIHKVDCQYVVTPSMFVELFPTDRPALNAWIKPEDRLCLVCLS